MPVRLRFNLRGGALIARPYRIYFHAENLGLGTDKVITKLQNVRPLTCLNKSSIDRLSKF
jgi:hypothetical protein